jgi:hypothetical protein
VPKTKTIKRLAAADIALSDLIIGSAASRYYLYQSAQDGGISFAGHELVKLPAISSFSGTGIEIIFSASVLLAAPIIYVMEYKILDKVYVPIYRKAAELYRQAVGLLRHDA